ncbi:MAG: AhpC/TSA family protein [Rhizobiaceae bacterium]|nr:AhpC/TSA family protein [Rhizobiaceae bacterium]
MSNKIKEGQHIPPFQARNIHGIDVAIPDGAHWTHVQFRRFAGCPVCNLHLQSFIARHDEIASAGIREVVLFHSAAAELLPYQGRFPFDVVGDPKKALYKRFGVSSSMSALLSPKAFMASLRGNLRKDKPELNMMKMPEGGILGLPADFLIGPDGVVKASHYGTHAYDQWTVDEVISLTRT